MLWDQIQSVTAKRDGTSGKNGASCGELYREDYARDFPSYHAFLCHWRALQAAEQAKTDPLQQAIRLMGLTEPFTQGRSQGAFPHPD